VQRVHASMLYEVLLSSPSVNYGLPSKFCALAQEGAGIIIFGRHVQIPIKNIYSESSCQELLIGIYIYMVPIGGGGGPGGFRVFWTPPPKIYWATPTKF